MTDWTLPARGVDAQIEQARALLTPWPAALDALGGLQSKRVGAYVSDALQEWRDALRDAGVITLEGRLTALGAYLADKEAERRFRDLFDI